MPAVLFELEASRNVCQIAEGLPPEAPDRDAGQDAGTRPPPAAADRTDAGAALRTDAGSAPAPGPTLSSQVWQPSPTLSPTDPVPRGLLTLCPGLHVYIYIYIYVCVCVCVCVCVYVCVYICMYIHIYIHIKEVDGGEWTRFDLWQCCLLAPVSVPLRRALAHCCGLGAVCHRLTHRCLPLPPSSRLPFPLSIECSPSNAARPHTLEVRVG